VTEDRGNEETEEQQEKRRPRVVDKRVSARGAGAAAETSRTESPPAKVPAAEPQPEEREPAEQVWTPEQEAEARRVADEIVKTPGPDWVINVAVTLANVAGVKLEAGELSDAGLVIDALAAVVNATGPRLGDAEAPLRRTLAQLQLGFAERTSGQPNP